MLRPAGKILWRCLIIAVVVFTATASAFVWRLSRGPVSLAFAAPLVRHALSFGEAGYAADFDDTVITWGGWQRNLDLRAVGVRLYDPEGNLVGEVPEVSVGFSAWALLHGMLAPTELDLFGAELHLQRDRTGRIKLGEVAAGPRGRTQEIIVKLVRALAREGEVGSRLSFLSRLSIIDATLVLDDHLAGREWRAPKARITLARAGSGLLGSLKARLVTDGYATGLSGKLDFRRAEGRLHLSVQVDGFEPAVFSGESGVLGTVANFKLPLSGGLEITIASDGTLEKVAFDVSAGGGTISLPPVYEQPRLFQQLAFRGTYNAAQRELRLDSGFFGLDGGASIEVQGLADFTDGLSGLRLFGSFDGLDAEKLPLYWPDHLAPGTRRWIGANLADAKIGEGRFEINLTPEALAKRPLPASVVDLVFHVSGATVRYLKAYPLARDVSGVVRMSLHRLTADIDSGRLDGFDDLKITGGTVLLDKIHIKGSQRADINIDLAGDLSQTLRLADQPPRQFVTRAGMKPENILGRAETHARFRFPLKPKVAFTDVDFDISATTTGADIRGLLKNIRTDNGTLSVQVNRRGLAATGTLSFNDIPATVVWSQQFDTGATAPSRYAVRASMTGEQLSSLGLPGTGIVFGPLQIALDLKGKGRFIEQGSGVADLATARIESPGIGYRKAPGAAARIDFTLHSDETGLKVDSFDAVTDQLKARGSLDLDIDNNLKLLTVDRFELREISLGLTARRQKGGMMSLDVKGDSFDARPLIRAVLFSRGSGQPLPAFSLNFDFDTVITENAVTVRNFGGVAEHIEDRWESVDADGKLPGGAVFRVAVDRVGTVRQLSMGSDDAGTIAKALGLYENGSGGEMILSAVVDDRTLGRPARGTLSIDNFRISHAPVLANVLTLGSLTGIGNRLQGAGISFDKMTIPFTLTGDVLRIEKGRAHGAAIGFTIDGAIDNAAETVDFSGTIIPAYTLNSFISNIPIVGTILGGREGGIFAFTYTVSGQRGAPEISVNPLSALAPGILRNIFNSGGTKGAAKTKKTGGGK